MVGSSIFSGCQLKIGITSHQGHPYFFAFSFSSVPAAYSACGIRITHGLAPQSTVTDPVHCFTALQFRWVLQPLSSIEQILLNIIERALHLLDIITVQRMAQ